MQSATASGQFHQPSRAICRRISRARRSSGFTCGHASWPQVVDVMERIKSSTRTHWRRYGSLIRCRDTVVGMGKFARSIP